MTPPFASYRFSQHKRCALLVSCFVPRSRNDDLAAFISNINIKPHPTSHCEERQFAAKQSIRLHHIDFWFYTLRKICQYINKLLYIYIKTFSLLSNVYEKVYTCSISYA